MNHLVINAGMENLFSYVRVSIICNQPISLLVSEIIVRTHFVIPMCYIKLTLALYNVERKALKKHLSHVALVSRTN